MSVLISVDPGKFLCGLAVFQDGKLVHAKLVESSKAMGSGPAVWVAMADAVKQTVEATELGVSTVVVEVMQVYKAGLQKGDPGDLIEVAGVSGAVCMAFPWAKTHMGFKPAQWKGQLPKAVMEKRIKEALSTTEIGRITKCSAALRHNVWDGIGIGLKALGRI